MGFEIPLGAQLRTALGEPGNIEKNQCVCVHLALGLEWLAQGKPRRVPNKARVMTIATQLRRAEFQQAQEFMDVCPAPWSKITDKLYSLARDVMTPPSR